MREKWMKAVQFDEYGPPPVLYLTDIDVPKLSRGDIRIRITAAAVNPADVKWRAGMFRDLVPVAMPHILGYDVSGLVDAVADDVTNFAPGDRVAVMLDPVMKGGYAELVVSDASNAALIPNSLDLALAAAIPTAGLTGLQLIEDHVRPAHGKTVLITGVTGAVGRFAAYAALQLGARVIGGVRASQVETALAMGIDQAIVMDDHSLKEGQFHHIADTVGGSVVSALCKRILPNGRIFTVATTPIDPRGLPVKPQFIAVRPDVNGLRRLIKTVAAGIDLVPIATRMPLAKAAEAHRLIELGGLSGKILLQP